MVKHYISSYVHVLLPFQHYACPQDCMSYVHVHVARTAILYMYVLQLNLTIGYPEWAWFGIQDTVYMHIHTCRNASPCT